MSLGEIENKLIFSPRPEKLDLAQAIIRKDQLKRDLIFKQKKPTPTCRLLYEKKQFLRTKKSGI